MYLQVKDLAEKSEKRAAIALQLKDGLLRLGPTFIKLGQLLSTRCVLVGGSGGGGAGGGYE